MKSGIYRIINTVNTKSYIGQSVNVKKRWKSHLNSYRCKRGEHPALHNAFDKYGINCFVFEVLCKAPKEYLNKLEFYFIKKFKTHISKHGYNCDSGGHGGGVSNPVYQFTLNGKFIKEYGSTGVAYRKTGVIQSSIYSCCKLDRGHAGGFLWTQDKSKIQDHINNYKKTLEKQKNKRVIEVSVYQVSLQGKVIKKHDSIKKASQETGAKNIIACLNNKRLTSGGFVWVKKVSKIDLVINRLNNSNQVGKGMTHYSKSVAKIDAKGKVIKIYSSIGEAAKNNKKVTAGNIVKVCKGERGKCGGYKWKYI